MVAGPPAVGNQYSSGHLLYIPLPQNWTNLIVSCICGNWTNLIVSVFVGHTVLIWLFLVFVGYVWLPGNWTNFIVSVFVGHTVFSAAKCIHWTWRLFDSRVISAAHLAKLVSVHCKKKLVSVWCAMDWNRSCYDWEEYYIWKNNDSWLKRAAVNSYFSFKERERPPDLKTPLVWKIVSAFFFCFRWRLLCILPMWSRSADVQPSSCLRCLVKTMLLRMVLPKTFMASYIN